MSFPCLTIFFIFEAIVSSKLKISSLSIEILSSRSVMLRVSLNAEETVTVFPALFFYPKAGGRRLKH